MEDTTGRQVTVNLAQATHSGKSTLALTGNISKVYLAVETKLVILFPYTANATSSSEEGEVDQSRPSYEMLLESCSKSLDSEWEIKRTPGQAHGAELPLKILLENELRQIVSSNSKAWPNLSCNEKLSS